MHPIPQAVHRLPVAVVSVGLQLPLSRQALQGLGLLGGGFPGIHQGDLTGLGIFLMHLPRIGAHVEGQITHVGKIIGKIFLEHIALVAAVDHEFVAAKAAVGLQDVPQNRPATSFHRWLGL